MKHTIALIGFGTVGRGIAEILLNKKEVLREKYGFDYSLVAVADNVYGNVYNPQGLNIARMLEEAGAGQKFSSDTDSRNTLELIAGCNASVVCELTYTNLKTGGPAMDHVRVALESGKHVVTTNKGPAALSYQEFTAIAAKHGVKFMIEGTVCAGTPVLNLNRGPLAGCEVSNIRGILNGTTNYILTEMEKGLDYATALKSAQELGYAEADPTGDVEGHDARGKVTILTNVVMGVPCSIDQVSCTGITGLTAADLEQARRRNCRWKLIGQAKKNTDGSVTASVAPEMIPLDHPLAGIDGTTNALTFTTDLLGDVTIVGPGAGKLQTGFAVLNDLLSL